MSEYTRKDFTCAVERHLWHSGLALAIYGKLYALTVKNGGHYFSSKERFMEYLGASRDGVDKAFKLLEKQGWIEREYLDPQNTFEIRKKEYRSKDYRVVSHNEWAEKHPGQCCVKELMPWDGEEQDKLGQDLWKFSGGKLKWFANQLAALRGSGLSDAEIGSEFRTLIGNVRNENDASGRYKTKGYVYWPGVRWKFVKRMQSLRLQVAG